jgi:hypothetical protein
MLSRRTFAVLVIMALVWALPIASAAAAGQGCVKKGTCEAPAEEDPAVKEDPHPDRGNPSPGTKPEEPPGNPNPGNKDPEGGTAPPSTGGGSGGGSDGGSGSTGGGGGGSTEEPTSSGSGEGGSGGGSAAGGGAGSPSGGGATGGNEARSPAGPHAGQKQQPSVGLERSTRGPRRVTFQPTDAGTGTQFFGGRDVLDAVANASHVAAFPLFLALIVAVFLLVQDRIDRADPKLARADKTKDYLSFD